MRPVVRRILRGPAMAVSSGKGYDDSDALGALRIFGAVLQALRQEAKLTQEEFALKIQYSTHYVSKIEQGKRFPPEDLPERVRSALGGMAANVLGAAQEGLPRKGAHTPELAWFEQWMDVEEEALTLHTYDSRVVPGLLQPEPYARKVLETHTPLVTEERMDFLLARRLHRQRILRERPNTTFTFVIEQAIIERGFGGPKVTRHLIDHLMVCAQLRNVEVQLMPKYQPEHTETYGSNYLAETPAHEWLGYVEVQQTRLMIADPHHVSGMLQRYSRLRAGALDPAASLTLLQEMRGKL